VRICAGGARQLASYRDSKYRSKRCLGRTEADRKIIGESWSSMQRSKKSKEDHA
jgi:hypothetical protein